ncbi:hypothetical protein Tco_0645875 [Tanacetum coccineum]
MTKVTDLEASFKQYKVKQPASQAEFKETMEKNKADADKQFAEILQLLKTRQPAAAATTILPPLHTQPLQSYPTMLLQHPNTTTTYETQGCDDVPRGSSSVLVSMDSQQGTIPELGRFKAANASSFSILASGQLLTVEKRITHFHFGHLISKTALLMHVVDSDCILDTAVSGGDENNTNGWLHDTETDHICQHICQHTNNDRLKFIREEMQSEVISVSMNYSQAHQAPRHLLMGHRHSRVAIQESILLLLPMKIL